MKLSNYSDYLKDWMYLERYVNDGSDHRFSAQTEVPQTYRPNSSKDYLSLYTLEGNFSKTEQVFDDDFYPVHPFTAGLYQKMGHALKETKVAMVPTSSTRTLLVYEGIDTVPFFAKLDLPVNISRFHRAINKSDVEFSAQINNVVSSLAVNDSPHYFGIFPEIGGGFVELQSGRQAGYLIREVYPKWLTKIPDSYFFIPSFSMISSDSKKAFEEPLLIQILKSSDDPERTLLQDIIYPLLTFWFNLADSGLLWELQQQNTLFVIDDQYKPIGVVARDFDGVYIDKNRREKIGEHTDFIKHILLTDEQLRKRYSLTFDHRLCKQNVLRLIACYADNFEDADKEQTIEKVRAFIAQKMPEHVKKCLPDDTWYTVPEVDFKQGIETIEIKKPPLR